MDVVPVSITERAPAIEEKTFILTMGVIKETKEWLEYGQVDDMEHIIEPAVSSSDNESLTNEPAHVSRRHKPCRSKPVHRDGSVIAQISQRRKVRELINMVESNDAELDFNMFEPSMSVFAELFAEKEKMQAWNDFINCSEEQQTAFLTSEPITECNHDDQGSDLDSTSDLDESWDTVDDKRASHPGFSAEECFQRVDKNIRSMLRRRHRPMGMLVRLEEEVVSFFTEWPNSVYVQRLSNSYERMMLHALCQYLQLNAKSFDSDDVRQTEVENPQPSFCSPPFCQI
ncbi:R3HD4-like protein [Mya arenaria]|uniref:R3HD4-like protein n=1 Tax=Mya arenaria TaxID=6604 RepID=A0ABY7FT57_MYAAR|nr:R3HD4-like protein [Mya arenaria]